MNEKETMKLQVFRLHKTREELATQCCLPFYLCICATLYFLSSYLYHIILQPFIVVRPNNRQSQLCQLRKCVCAPSPPPPPTSYPSFHPAWPTVYNNIQHSLQDQCLGQVILIFVAENLLCFIFITLANGWCYLVASWNTDFTNKVCLSGWRRKKKQKQNKTLNCKLNSCTCKGDSKKSIKL